jgi:alkaline phosphatase
MGMKSTAAGALAMVLLGGAGLCGAVQAQAIYPIDRAAILAGSKFDLKVEFLGAPEAGAVTVTVNGADHAQAFGRAASFVEKEKDVDASALLLRGVSIDKPGEYEVTATDGKNSRTVKWEVYDTAGQRQAKSVILLIGDGMSVAHRTAARILSKGIDEGKYRGTLAMDAMPHMALLGTSGVDSVMPDSANTASAYATGHKSSVNALGVYADRTKDTLDDPKVELISEIAKRKRGMAIGIVTNTEIEDATPAAFGAHTRRRADYNAIVDQYFAFQPDVLMGGGLVNFLPKSRLGSKRADETDYVAKFGAAGYALATTGAEMKDAADSPRITKLLGLFHTGSMDGVYDRKYLKKGTVETFPNQPDLTEQVQAALDVLSRNENGFFLMVESGLIDKYSHPLDWERAVMDTIMLDKAVEIAKSYAASRGDTLVLVTADHSHGLSIVGTVDDEAKGEDMREKIGVYGRAGYPNYPAPDADGYPNRLDVSKRLAIFFSNFPDYYETFRPKLDNPFIPAVPNGKREYVANEAYKNVPGAVLRTGVLPRGVGRGVHTGEDVVLTAMGPGSERVAGFMENTEVFRIIAEALALGAGGH